MAQLTARVPTTQVVAYLRKTVTFGSGAAAYVGTLPAGAQIVDAIVNVTVAFNAATTNVLTVGTNSTAYDSIFAAADITEGTIGGYRAPAITALDQVASDTDVYCSYTSTGTAATTGAATIVITYACNNDL